MTKSENSFDAIVFSLALNDFDKNKKNTDFYRAPALRRQNACHLKPVLRELYAEILLSFCVFYDIAWYMFQSYEYVSRICVICSLLQVN